MRIVPILAWAAGLWLAVGAETFTGGGMPGPVLLLAIAAGLWAGIPAGIIVGAAAGLCEAAVGGSHVTLLMLFSMLAGAAGGLITRRLSKRNIFSAVLAAIAITFILAVSQGALASVSMSVVLAHAAVRSAANALWMTAIYGMILMFSAMHTPRVGRWEY